MKYVQCKEGDSNLVLTLPHSAIDIPESIEHHLNLKDEKVVKCLAVGTDLCVPYVTGFHEYDSATRIWTVIPRGLLDVNRLKSQADKYAVEGGNDQLDPHGLIHRSTSGHHEHELGDMLTHLYSQKELESLLQLGYYPFEQKVKQNMDRAITNHGIAIHFDLHSMPGYTMKYAQSGKHKGAYLMDKKVKRGMIKDGGLPDIALISACKETCGEPITDIITNVFSDHDILVDWLIMRPGTKNPNHRYANKKKNRHSMAVEIVGHNFEPGRAEGKYLLDLTKAEKFKNGFHDVFEALEGYKP